METTAEGRELMRWRCPQCQGALQVGDSRDMRWHCVNANFGDEDFYDHMDASLRYGPGPDSTVVALVDDLEDLLAFAIEAEEALRRSVQDETARPLCYCRSKERQEGGDEWVDCAPCLGGKALATWKRLFPAEREEEAVL